MSDIALQAGDLLLRLNTRGGAITGFWLQQEGKGKPFALLRPRVGGTPACFPLVPFGNRVRDNRFTFDGRDYTLKPNTSSDRHYLHGDGWQADWSVIEKSGNKLAMQFEHRSGTMGYNYQARQIFSLSDEKLEITLEIKNMGAHTLPFGLGWHRTRTKILDRGRRFLAWGCGDSAHGYGFQPAWNTALSLDQ